MKILFVTNHFLDGNGGGVFASRAYINAFAELSSSITLLYPDNGKNISEKLSTKINLKGIKYDKNKILKLLDIYKGKINRFQDLVVKEASEINADLVVFDNSRSSAGSIEKLKDLGFKVITIHHNYEMEYYKACKPPIYGRNRLMSLIKKTEKNAVQYSDLNLTLTQQDKELLQKNYDKKREKKFDVIGVFEFSDKEVENIFNKKENNNQEINFVISGSLDAEQTEISLFPFLKKYYPILIEKVPNIKLIIAGRNPSNKLIEFCKLLSNIEIIANPLDMIAVIKNSDFYICPISVGGGLKLRIMDGLKLGIPVLTHQISARGYDKFIEKDIMFSYHDEKTFEIELMKMIKSEQNRLQNINFYKKYFSFEAGSSNLSKILKEKFYN